MAESFLGEAGADEEEGCGEAGFAEVVERGEGWVEAGQVGGECGGYTEEEDEPGEG